MRSPINGTHWFRGNAKRAEVFARHDAVLYISRETGRENGCVETLMGKNSPFLFDEKRDGRRLPSSYLLCCKTGS
ncbi:MAG: hypothetical protein IT388_02580 [Nitrospirales bacterium]|nr:hypothetical protein [Nitrospirales bacterium]